MQTYMARSAMSACAGACLKKVIYTDTSALPCTRVCTPVWWVAPGVCQPHRPHAAARDGPQRQQE